MKTGCIRTVNTSSCHAMGLGVYSFVVKNNITMATIFWYFFVS